MEDTKEGP